MQRLALALTITVAISGTAFAQPPPASAFGRLPGVQDAEISPDGKRILILGGDPVRRTVKIATVDSPEMRVVGLGDVESLGVRWAGNDYAIVRLSFWDKVDLRQEYNFERSAVIDTDGKIVSYLLADQETPAFGVNQPIVRVVEGDKPAAMVLAPTWNSRGAGIKTRNKNALQLALWRVDLRTGRGEVEERGPFHSGWGVDRSGQARLRWEIDRETETFRLLGRAKGEQDWKQIAEGSDDDLDVSYSDAEDAAYFKARKADGALATIRRTLADDRTEEVQTLPGGEDFLWDPHLSKPVAALSGFGPPQYLWFDPEIQAVHAVLAKAFPGRQVNLQGWSRDRTRYIVRITAPDFAPQWSLYDKTRREVSPIGEEYPELKGVALGKTSVVSYKARDGLAIAAYLTLPPGAPAGAAKAPLVILPHWGVADHDAFDFDWWAQFMASRGYAVLQPQVRGSTGFGLQFEEAGRREWGGKIQTDLLDGIAYLAAQGIVDPARVCIVGASLGGYVALAGATMHPQAYRCAISVNGVSDLPALVSQSAARRGYDDAAARYFRRDQQESTGGSALMIATSPNRLVGPSTPPILLISSDQNTTIDPGQSASMSKALTEAGKDAYIVKLEGDDHYLLKSASRIKLLQAVDEFLARHLPVAR